MASQEHVDILRQGVEVWNTWREMHPYEQPDLTSIDLSGANLFKSNLLAANLSGAKLSGVNLSGADLSMAIADGIDLSKATLDGTDFSHANLKNANLHWSNLFSARLSWAHLEGADFTNVTVGWTIFAGVDLQAVKGLETLRHLAPSSIGIDTILHSEGDIPENFLRNAGLNDSFINYALSQRREGIQHHSCFISYSSKDQAFAECLYADLQNNNVHCWYAPEDMKTGDRIRPRIYEQIWFNDKLLLVLSESSVKSEWVDYEVETALARERKENRDILFPIRVDDAIKESKAAWAAHIQSTRHITDFTRWKDHGEYQKRLKRLLRDLKQEALHDKL